MSFEVVEWQWVQWPAVTHGQPKAYQLLVQFTILMLQHLLLLLPLLSLCCLLCAPLLLQQLLDHVGDIMHHLGVVMVCIC